MFKVSTTNDKELILPKFLQPTQSSSSATASSSLSGTSWQLIPPGGVDPNNTSLFSSVTSSGKSSSNQNNFHQQSAVQQSSSSSHLAIGSSGSLSSDPIPSVILQDGPLSYRYTLSHLTFHYGRQINHGSEHLIDGAQFPGEVQLYFYNSQLYSSFEEASGRSNGIAAIAMLIQVSPDSKLSNPQLKRITHALKNITLKGSSQYIHSLSISDLTGIISTNNVIMAPSGSKNFENLAANSVNLPSNFDDKVSPSSGYKQYITYEGSLTEPGCYETVTWIILNKPIYMTNHLFHSLIHSMSSESSHHSADNFRPIQKLNGRSMRTNIDFSFKFHSNHPFGSDSVKNRNNLSKSSTIDDDDDDEVNY